GQRILGQKLFRQKCAVPCMKVVRGGVYVSSKKEGGKIARVLTVRAGGLPFAGTAVIPQWARNERGVCQSERAKNALLEVSGRRPIRGLRYQGRQQEIISIVFMESVSRTEQQRLSRKLRDDRLGVQR